MADIDVTKTFRIYGTMLRDHNNIKIRAIYIDKFTLDGTVQYNAIKDQIDWSTQELEEIPSKEFFTLDKIILEVDSRMYTINMIHK